VKNRRLSSRVVYEGRIIRLRLDEVELPGGAAVRREVIEHPGAAAIVPLDEKGNLRLVRQYRDAIAEELVEIPAGKLKLGEEPAACARRELRAELGLEAGRLDHLSTCFSTPGFCDAAMHVYLARDLSSSAREGDGEELIEPLTLPLEPLEGLLAGLKDGKSIAGIMLAIEFLGREAGGS